ncbi:MAG: Dna2/Cas4 domain-containing protein [Chloroflexota bacterium]
MRPIRVSEISTYLYCHRAWWYRRQGVEPENQEELEAGQILHYQHGRSVKALDILRLMAFCLFFLGFILLVISIMSRAL